MSGVSLFNLLRKEISLVLLLECNPWLYSGPGSGMIFICYVACVEECDKTSAVLCGVEERSCSYLCQACLVASCGYAYGVVAATNGVPGVCAELLY